MATGIEAAIAVWLAGALAVAPVGAPPTDGGAPDDATTETPQPPPDPSTAAAPSSDGEPSTAEPGAAPPSSDDEPPPDGEETPRPPSPEAPPSNAPGPSTAVPLTIDARTATPAPPIPPPKLVYEPSASPGSSIDARMSPHRRLLVRGGIVVTTVGVGLGVASLVLALIAENEFDDARERYFNETRFTGRLSPAWQGDGPPPSLSLVNTYRYASLGTGIGAAVYGVSGVVMLALGLSKPRRAEVTPIATPERAGLQLRLRF